jgi:hypothetical protein
MDDERPILPLKLLICDKHSPPGRGGHILNFYLPPPEIERQLLFSYLTPESSALYLCRGVAPELPVT